MHLYVPWAATGKDCRQEASHKDCPMPPRHLPGKPAHGSNRVPDCSRLVNPHLPFVFYLLVCRKWIARLPTATGQGFPYGRRFALLSR